MEWTEVADEHDLTANQIVYLTRFEIPVKPGSVAFHPTYGTVFCMQLLPENNLMQILYRIRGREFVNVVYAKTLLPTISTIGRKLLFGFWLWNLVTDLLKLILGFIPYWLRKSFTIKIHRK